MRKFLRFQFGMEFLGLKCYNVAMIDTEKTPEYFSWIGEQEKCCRF